MLPGAGDNISATAGRAVRSTCSFCGVGCGVVARRDGAGRLAVEGDPDHPVNRGMLCSKGRALHHVVEDTSDRLLHPQMRHSREHPLERVDWDTALTRAAAVVRATIERHGPESVGLYVSGQCLTEEYYVANKVMKGFIGANNIDTNSRLCMSSAVVGYKLALGDDLCPISYDDIELGDCFLLAGANPAFCHPILFRRLEQRKQAHPEARVIVVDPRRTQSCAVADLHLQIQPGTDIALYNAISRILLESGAVDHQFIVNHTEGFERLRGVVMRQTVDEAAALCRVPALDVRTAAAWIAESNAFQSWWAMGLNQSVSGVDNNLALINLSLLTGQIGKPGAGPFSLTGQPNAMGGREVGGLATMLAAHRDLSNPAHREEIARYWGVPQVSDKPGRTATEMFDALESGEMRVIWILCTNPAVSLPGLRRVERALRKARFVIVQDISDQSDTLHFADLVLPAAGWLEKQGVMTNSERRVSLLEKLVEPPGEALPDAEILCRFAAKMGWGASFNYPSPEAIFNEHRELTRGTPIDIGGISYERLRREGSVQWPCPSAEHPGTPRLFTDGCFATPNQRARLSAVEFVPAAEAVSPEFPFIVTTGRLREQWHTMTRTGKVRKLRMQEPVPFVEIHPDDAASREISEGDMVRVMNSRGSVVVRARFSDAIKPGTVFLPMHWSKSFHAPEARANLVTSSQVDPKSKQPGFKFSAVDLAPISLPSRRIVIIGGGAAALHFISEFRKVNRVDSITVLANELVGFYNRVQLPQYIAGEHSWADLSTCTQARLDELGVTLHSGAAVTRIDRAGRFVVDDRNRKHGYEALIIATGSRAAVPRDAPASPRGVFTLRNRHDADAIQQHAVCGASAVVLGGGLLGIELAVALQTMGLHVTLLHRSSRLMGAQLDDTASELLCFELRAKGIDVVLQDSLARVHGGEKVLGVRTREGAYFPCSLLVFAVGTRPNDELARAAGIACGDGIIVDDALRTSDPAVMAIGECAEHRGQRHGTTLAATQQAAIASAQLAGDLAAVYTGSMPLHLLKARGISLASMGRVTPPEDAETISLEDRAERFYIKCIVLRNRLIGAILLGDTTLMAQFKQWIETGAELDAERRALLRPGTRTDRNPAKGRLVCSCNQVGRGNISDAIAAGCGSVDELVAQTGAGSGCGSCRPELALMLMQLDGVPA